MSKKKNVPQEEVLPVEETPVEPVEEKQEEQHEQVIIIKQPKQ